MNTQKVFIPIHAWYNFAFYPFYSLKSIHRCPSQVFSCKTLLLWAAKTPNP